MYELRTFIRSVIAEAAIDTTHASMSYLALYIGSSYVLYDLLTYSTIMQSDVEYHDAVPSIVAMLATGAQTQGHAWNAVPVVASAALPGYGPLIYDIAMAQEGGLMADREVVTNAAKKVWQYYKDSRPDVIAKPLDDESDPKTEPTIDDAHVYSDDAENPLNYAYFATRKPDITKLLSNHEKCVKYMQSKLSFSRKNIEKHLDISASTFFDRKYRASF